MTRTVHQMQYPRRLVLRVGFNLLWHLGEIQWYLCSKMDFRSIEPTYGQHRISCVTSVNNNNEDWNLLQISLYEYWKSLTKYSFQNESTVKYAKMIQFLKFPNEAGVELLPSRISMNCFFVVGYKQKRDQQYELHCRESPSSKSMLVKPSQLLPEVY